MKKLLRWASELPGLCSVAIAVAAAGLGLAGVTGASSTPAKAVGRHVPAPHAGFPVGTRPLTPYVPLVQWRESTLWTVRSRYDSLIESVARRHEVDPALVKAIVQAESAFDPDAVSRSGARGLMQILPETASRFSIQDLSDPHQNLRAGVKYLKYLLDTFDGNVAMALAAYNAGPNTVRRYRGIPPFSETRRYLSKVLGLRNAYTDPSRRS